MVRIVSGICLLLLSFSVQAATSIGVITDVEGDVKLLRGDSYFAVDNGVEVFQSDALETGQDSKAQIDMVDGTNLLIGPGTRIRLSEYEVADDNSVTSAVVDVLSGWMRFAVAKLNDLGSYDIDTPTMTIGVRGTEGVIEAGDQKSGLFLEEGKVELFEVAETDSAAPAAPLAVGAGQYAERLRGQRLQRQAMRRAIMRERLPLRMRIRLARRIHLLQRRGVTPRMLRVARRQELARFLWRNPQARKKLRQFLLERSKKRRELRRQKLFNLKQRLQQRRLNR